MYESHLFMSSVFIRKDGGVILGIFLEKQEKVSRVQDGCPIANVWHDGSGKRCPRHNVGHEEEEGSRPGI
jgi:hypothetical protein